MCSVGYPQCANAVWEKTCKASAWYNPAQSAFEQRCDADLLYALFENPGRILHLETGSVGGEREQICLVDRILSAFTEMVAKKNHPNYQRSGRITKANKHLSREGSADDDIKLFNILFMIHRETELQEVIRSGYIANHPASYWGEDNWETHFEWFLSKLGYMIEMTLNFSYNEMGIVSMVRDFVQEARKFYIIRGA